MIKPYKAGAVVVGIAALIAAISQLPATPGLEDEETPDMTKICIVDPEAPNYDYESEPRPPLTWLDKHSDGVELTPENGVPKWVEGEIAFIPSPGVFFHHGENRDPNCWSQPTTFTQVSEPGTGYLITIAAPIILFSLRKYG